MNYKDFGMYILIILISIVMSYIMLSITHGPEIIESWKIGLFSGLGGLLFAFLFSIDRKKGEQEEDKKDENEQK